MKKTVLFYFINVFLTTCLNAQEEKQSLSFNAILTHYMQAKDSYLGIEHGYYFLSN